MRIAIRFFWARLDAWSLVVLVVMAILIVAVTIGLARAYQSPRPQIIATFDYAYLIFAAFWGFVFFAELPDLGTLIGIALIISAGVLVIRVGRSRKRSVPDRLRAGTP